MVKRLMRLWQLYSKVNNTNIDTSILDDWETFLNDTASFIHEFDFVKDMAVEDPGDSPVIGGFQLEFVSISRVINHMTCYKFECSHWWKIYLKKILYKICSPV